MPRAGGVLVRMIDLVMQSLRSWRRLQQEDQSEAKKLVRMVVAPAPASASPDSYAHRSRSRTHEKGPEGPANAKDTSRKAFHEWLAERTATIIRSGSVAWLTHTWTSEMSCWTRIARSVSS